MSHPRYQVVDFTVSIDADPKGILVPAPTKQSSLLAFFSPFHFYVIHFIQLFHHVSPSRWLLTSGSSPCRLLGMDHAFPLIWHCLFQPSVAVWNWMNPASEPIRMAITKVSVRNPITCGRNGRTASSAPMRMTILNREWLNYKYVASA